MQPKVGYLRLGTYVTYKMEMDWKGFLKDAFTQMDEQGAEHLILDIRGNGGGMDEVNEALNQYLVQQPARQSTSQTRLAFDIVPGSLRPYLSTWDNSIFDLRKRVEASGEGYFVEKRARQSERKYTPGRKAWKGKTWLLTDAANSSATFYTAQFCKENQMATLVGEPTGGNQKGITGGMMFFLRLPNSGIEIDIPILGSFPTETRPDAGIEPNILIETNASDIAQGIDPVLARVLAEIAKAGGQKP